MKAIINKIIYILRQYGFITIFFVFLFFSILIISNIIFSVFRIPQKDAFYGVYHRQGIIQTEDGRYWEVEQELVPASEYTVIINDNGTPKDTSDDYIEHVTQYQKLF